MDNHVQEFSQSLHCQRFYYCMYKYIYVCTCGIALEAECELCMMHC